MSKILDNLPESTARGIQITLADGNARQLVEGDFFCTGAIFFGVKSFSSGTPTNNSANLNMGTDPTQLPSVIGPGGELVVGGGGDTKINLNKYYVKGTANDGVFIQYWG